jgi:hypothetical protein
MKKSQGAKSGEYIVKRGVVIVKQPGLFSPKLGATSSHVFTQSPQSVKLEPGIHSLACWDLCFALPQLLYRWRRQSGIFWILPRIFERCPVKWLVWIPTVLKFFTVFIRPYPAPEYHFVLGNGRFLSYVLQFTKLYINPFTPEFSFKF